MRFALIGTFSKNFDEGMRNVGKNLRDEFSKTHDVHTLEINEKYSFAFWNKLKKINPDLVYTTYGPSIRVLIFMKIVKLFCRHSISIIHATHPAIENIPFWIVKLMEPDLVFVNSSVHKRLFETLHFKNVFLVPLGVNTTKFKPVTIEDKLRLREKFNINPDHFVILHVGHLKYSRNVQFLSKIQGETVQAVIVGSSSTCADKGIISELRDAGCIVIDNYVEKIEELYQFSDCYVFPTESMEQTSGNKNADAIEIPLSILEAMACNLPVITTKYGGLPDFFEEKDGFFYFNEANEFPKLLSIVQRSESDVHTREVIQSSFTWERIASLIRNKISTFEGRNENT